MLAEVAAEEWRAGGRGGRVGEPRPADSGLGEEVERLEVQGLLEEGWGALG